MIEKVKGIVIKNTRYSENSIISKIFTNQYGLQSFIIQGLGLKNSALKNAYFMTGNELEMVVYYKQNTQIYRIKEAKPTQIYQHYKDNQIKMCLVQFYLEVIYISVEEQSKDIDLYQLLIDYMSKLEHLDTHLVWYPIHFLIDFIEINGHLPDISMYQSQYCININEGRFTPSDYSGSEYFNEHETSLFVTILLDKQTVINCNYNERIDLLSKLIRFCEIHIFRGKALKSLDILRSVLAN